MFILKSLYSPGKFQNNTIELFHSKPAVRYFYISYLITHIDRVLSWNKEFTLYNSY